MTTVSDDLNRPDAPNLGAGWVNHNGTMSIVGGMAKPNGLTTWNYSSSTTVMATGDMEASVTLGPYFAPHDHVLLYVGANDAGQLIFAYFYNQVAYFWTQGVWASYGMISNTPMSYAEGDTLTLRRNGTVYTILKNGVDTGFNVNTTAIPIDASHLQVGFGLYTDNGTGYRMVDSFSAKDTAVSPALSGGGTLSATVEVVTPPSGFAPTDLSGCTVWLDATQLSSLTTQWPDLSGNNHHGAVVGTPAPTIVNNSPYGLPVVRFKANEGRVRGSGMYPAATPNSSFTVMFVGRQWGPTIGRIFSNPYPPFNFLVGTHASGRNSCFDAGWINSGVGWTTPPTPWTTWGFVYHGSPNLGTFFVDGVDSGSSAGGGGHDDRWNLSGYSDTGGEESCDVEVAELVIYDRDLTTTERQQVEEYLHDKWFEEGGPEPPIPVAAAFSGGGSLSATVTASYPASASLTGGGSLSATVHKWASPADTPGLGLWLDASQLTGFADGEDIWTWSDASSAARHATAGDSLKPRYRPAGLNGHPAVDFSSGVRRMRIPTFGTALSGKTEYTLFYVAKVASFGYSVIATAPPDTLWRWLLEYEPSGGFYWGHGNGYFRQYYATMATNTPYALTFLHAPSGPHYYINGSEAIGYYLGGSGDIQATVPNVDGDVILGAYYEGSYPVDGVIAEFIWYDHALTTAERLQVEDYLNEKYFGAAPPSTPISVSFSGSGSLSATGSESYARAPALAGGGTLSATATTVETHPSALTLGGSGSLSVAFTRRHPVAAATNGAGALSNTVKQTYPLAPALNVEGVLSAVVKPIRTVTAGLGSTGQLQTSVTTIGGEFPGNDTGWTTDPTPPSRLYGSTWTTPGDVALLQKTQGSSWFPLIQRVSQPGGDGTLQMSVKPVVGTIAGLSGAGSLTNTMFPRGFRTIPTFANGVLLAEAWPVKALSVDLTGLGSIDFGGINEGLHGTIQVGYAARLNAAGTLTTFWEGGNPNYDDGLTGIVIGRYVIPGIFASTGQLVAFAGKLDAAFTYLSAQGFLTASTTQIYPLMANLASTGQLSATTFGAYQKLVNLIGSGTLSATAFAVYLRSLGVSGAGALTALLVASYQAPAAASSVGSVTATVAQVYFFQPALSGEGSLTSFYASTRFADLTGDGSLTGSTKPVLPLLASLLGTGQLSATAFQRYLASIGVSGAGVLVAALLASYKSAPAGGGTGSVSATVMPRYRLSSGFGPTDITGCTVWLDASQLTGSDGASIGTQWNDLSGNNHHGAVVGSSPPVIRAGANGLNSKKVVRFTQDEGRVRGDGMCVEGSYNLTILYVGRFWTTNASRTGRIFSNAYGPPGYFYQ